MNLDFYARAVEAADHVFTLLGEGTFHQVHGGAATGLNQAELKEALGRWSEESAKVRGQLPGWMGRSLSLRGICRRSAGGGCRWMVQLYSSIR